MGTQLQMQLQILRSDELSCRSLPAVRCFLLPHFLNSFPSRLDTATQVLVCILFSKEENICKTWLTAEGCLSG